MLSKNSLTNIFELFVLPLLSFWIIFGELRYLVNSPIFFVFIFLVVFFIVCLFVIKLIARIKNKDYIKLRLLVVIFICLFILTIIFSIAMINRQQIDSKLTHDGALLTEFAADLILEGKNPYVENYSKTLLYDWDLPGGLLQVNNVAIKNPALDYYIYPPLNFLVLVPFRAIFEMDYRYLLAVFFIISYLALLVLFKDYKNKIIISILYLLNPFLVSVTLFGMNEVIVLSLFIISIIFLHKKKLWLSAIFFALAILFKQYLILFLPFYLIYLLVKNNKCLREVIIIFVIISTIFLPFLIWNFNAVVEDVVLFPLGLTESVYPITGFSLLSILYNKNVIDDMYYAPNWSLILQVVICLPLLAYFLYLIYKKKRISWTIMLFAIWLIVFWFLARFFNINYIAFCLHLLVLSYIWYLIEKEKEKINEKTN